MFLVLSLLLAAPAARASEFQIAADSFTVANQFNISSVSYLGAMPAAPDNPALATQLATPGGLYFDGTYYKVWDRTALAWVQLTTGTVEGRVARTGDFMSGQLTTASTITVQGNAFSMGISTFVVIGGNVGIGTTTPQVSLDVGGGIRAGSQTTVTICNSPLEGTQRYNYSIHALEYCNGADWTSMTASTAPAAFSFTNQTNVYFNYTITSNAVTLAGFVGSLTAACGTGCTGISYNGGAFSAGPVAGFVAGDTIAIRQTSSGGAYTTTTATVSVGGTTSGAWDVTTGAAPAAFSFTDQTNVYRDSTITSNAVTLTGFVGPVTATCGAGCTGISRSGGLFEAGPVAGFMAGNTIAIRQTSSGDASTQTTATVSVGGTTSGAWSVTTGASYHYTFTTATAGTTFVVPAGATSLTVKMWGAGGGGATGGGGGFAQATIAVTPGESLTVMVGGPGGLYSGGLNGGGGSIGTGSYGNGGGGYSALMRGGAFLMQAGGGGGGSGYPGGAGGGAIGLAGSSYSTAGGGGGTSTAGGAGGVGVNGAPSGTAGSANTGGTGTGDNIYYSMGGGGGGGRFGGGGGGGDDLTGGGGGGGGGSSFVTGTATVETAGAGTTPGNNTDPDRTGNAGNPGYPGLVVVQ